MRAFNLSMVAVVKFSQENSVRGRNLSTLAPWYMLEGRGWRAIGWAYSKDVAPRADCRYVCLFEDESGIQAWCHATTSNLHLIAQKTSKM